MLTIYDFASCIWCGAVTYPCSAAAPRALPPPSLGVSSLDLGRWQPQRPFFRYRLFLTG